jgi:hypothetical protein
MKQPRSKIFLSRRNLLALLSKLDRVRAGEMSACSIIKHQSARPAYKQTSKAIVVTAVEDELYYSALERSAGAMVEADERHLSKPPQGIAWPIDFLDSGSDDEDVVH